mmetsp:Transcript_25759/g.45345  ORF Transcript_25759/g.45345 Transcript_25759/m.45345 type:complete len:169 (-) Transcript_25759:5195-5701(-)
MNRWAWTQGATTEFSAIPDDFLTEMSIIEEPQVQVRLSEIAASWAYIPPKFNPTKAWTDALRHLKIPLDDTHMGRGGGDVLRPPFSACNLGTLVAHQKAPLLLVQVTEISNKQFTVQDFIDCSKCNVHPQVWEQHSIAEGNSLLLKEVTVLPGNVLNVVPRNIIKVFS